MVWRIIMVWLLSLLIYGEAISEYKLAECDDSLRRMRAKI